MRVLAAIVIPPHLAASGAVNAALAISQRLSRNCSIDVALMSDETSQSQLGNVQLLKAQVP